MESNDERAEVDEARDDDARARDHADEPDWTDDDSPDEDRLRLGSTTDAMLTALLDAGPEAVEHLLKAAQELLLAAKAVVDAAERAVEVHRSASDSAPPDKDARGRARVHRIDLA